MTAPLRRRDFVFAMGGTVLAAHVPVARTRAPTARPLVIGVGGVGAAAVEMLHDEELDADFWIVDRSPPRLAWPRLRRTAVEVPDTYDVAWWYPPNLVNLRRDAARVVAGATLPDAPIVLAAGLGGRVGSRLTPFLAEELQRYSDDVHVCCAELAWDIRHELHHLPLVSCPSDVELTGGSDYYITWSGARCTRIELEREDRDAVPKLARGVSELLGSRSYGSAGDA